MNESRYLQWVRASAWYDLLVTWPFATPWTFAWLYARLVDLSAALSLPGELHALDATHVLLANLMGSVVLVWALARIQGATVRLGRLDAVARMMFAAAQLHAVWAGANAIVLGFTVFEIALGLVQWLPVRGATAPRRP